jgi:hypothetical protein
VFSFAFFSAQGCEIDVFRVRLCSARALTLLPARSIIIECMQFVPLGFPRQRATLIDDCHCFVLFGPESDKFINKHPSIVVRLSLIALGNIKQAPFLWKLDLNANAYSHC